MHTDILGHLNALEAALQRDDRPGASLALARTKAAFAPMITADRRTAAQVRRYQELLARAVHLATVRGAEPVARDALDTIISVVRARRGFIGQLEQRGWSLLAARDNHEGDLAEPDELVSTSIIDEALRTGQPVITHDASSELSAMSVQAMALRSVICLPLFTEDTAVGFVYLDHTAAQGQFDAAAVDAVQGWLPLVAGCVLRERADSRNAVLPGVITRSSTLISVLQELARIARFDVPILLTGETGTGKSMIARQIHLGSPRAAGPFVHVNCGALPESLIVAELFGAEPGAFTGARGRRVGRFEAAHGGTLFLDELDAMPLDCQVKLLVALQDRVITRLGSNTPTRVDVRVIAATNRDPQEAIHSGLLREDLYYRLAVFVSHLPPLRERPQDIPLLARHFLERARERYDLSPLRLDPVAEQALLNHSWPGNVRELVNTLDRAALLSRDGLISRVRTQRPSPAEDEVASGHPVVARLRGAASALVSEMLQREDLRDLKSLGVFRGAVLNELVGRLGTADAAFRFLGLQQQIERRNHTRTLSRETGKLNRFVERLGDR